jgi:hypothetical protein
MAEIEALHLTKIMTVEAAVLLIDRSAAMKIKYKSNDMEGC